MPIFFAIQPQMFPFTQNYPFTQNSIVNNISNSPSTPSRQSVPSLDEFFIQLDELSGGTGEFTSFKDIFEKERITVNQIYDLTDVEFDQLGINKIGWRKTFRAAAQRYK